MLDFILKQYAAILQDLDTMFAQCQTSTPEIPCKKCCYDCCKQLFPLSLLEAYYINQGFLELPRTQRRELENKAKKIQEKLEKALDFHKYEVANTDIADIAERRNLLTHDLQSTGTDCPLLTEEGICSLYEKRNHDCRIHGASIDEDSGEIIGCFRHKEIFGTDPMKAKFVTHAIPSGHRYKEKSKLDSMLLVQLTGDESLSNVFYFTTPLIPLLKDFTTQDLPTLIKEKANKLQHESKPKNYSLIIDTSY